MRNVKSDRGFQFVVHPAPATEERLVSQSSGVGEGDSPGTSFLWIGQHHHLGRAEVRQLVDYLQRWLDTGKLFTETPGTAEANIALQQKISEPLRDVLEAGVNLVESAYVHVTHGGPTMVQAMEWVKKARKAIGE